MGIVGGIKQVPAAAPANDKSGIRHSGEMEGQAVWRQVQVFTDVSRSQTIHAGRDKQAQHAKARFMG